MLPPGLLWRADGARAIISAREYLAVLYSNKKRINTCLCIGLWCLFVRSFQTFFPALLKLLVVKVFPSFILTILF